MSAALRPCASGCTIALPDNPRVPSLYLILRVSQPCELCWRDTELQGQERERHKLYRPELGGRERDHSRRCMWVAAVTHSDRRTDNNTSAQM